MTEPAARDREMVETVQKFQAGEQTAFETLIRTYQGSVYAIILGTVRSREDAMDLTQDVFLRAYRYAKSLKDPRKFSAWLGSIARNTAVNHVRRSRVERSMKDAVGRSETAREKSSAKEVAEALTAIEELDEIYRTPFLLKYLDERPVDEIAALLDLPVSTVEGRLYQARLQLRKKLIL